MEGSLLQIKYKCAGFAYDGYMVYYSRNGTFKSSWGLVDKRPESTNCVYNTPADADIPQTVNFPDNGEPGIAGNSSDSSNRVTCIYFFCCFTIFQEQVFSASEFCHFGSVIALYCIRRSMICDKIIANSLLCVLFVKTRNERFANDCGVLCFCL